MKTVIWILIAGVVVIGGYLWFAGQQAPAPVTETASQAESTASKVDTAIQDAAKTTAEKVDDAAQEAEEAADSAAADAAKATEEAASDAAGAASDAADATTEAADAVAGDAAAALTVTEFDYDKVVAMIDGSGLNPTQKTVLKTGLDQARSNPGLLQAMLDQIKAELGL